MNPAKDFCGVVFGGGCVTVNLRAEVPLLLLKARLNR